MMANTSIASTMTGFEYLLLRLSGLLVPLAIAPWAIALVGIPAGWWEPEGRWAVYLICTVLAVMGARRWTLAVRERFVREAPLPQLLKRKLRDIYPLLSPKDADLVERGLRQFFMACLRSDKHFVAMPSRAVDALWSAFCQSPQAYQNWCQNALGYAPEHSPAQVLGKKAHHNDGLRRAWYWACKDEAAYRCCLRWTPSWPFPTGFTMLPAPQTARTRAAPNDRAACSTSAPTFQTITMAAASRTLVALSLRAAVPAPAPVASALVATVILAMTAAIEPRNRSWMRPTVP